ncbi:MAG: lytic transglycosylase domain-containing protein [Candidatus Competibacteraceae bacterium]|nr:lytic transglycosylase domain-containing protein [Candidatus Competibacteraceae bacterium]
MIESAFDPAAVSPKGAAGLWQIMPATGEQYGLQIIEGYDGRYDVHASTLAALEYLSYLHRFFKGDWLLALAAYNAGEGRVQQAMQANLDAGQDTDFWNLNLPKETQAYVPKMLALARIVFNPRHYGLKLQKLHPTLSRQNSRRPDGRNAIRGSDCRSRFGAGRIFSLQSSPATGHAHSRAKLRLFIAIRKSRSPGSPATRSQVDRHSETHGEKRRYVIHHCQALWRFL